MPDNLAASLEVVRRDDVDVLRMQHGSVNALDREFLDEITGRLRDLAESSDRPLVITGRGTAFSAGADLFRVIEGGAGYVDESVGALTEAFEALFTFPRPLIAAVNGHAIAGGCIITCACDYRVMAKGSGVIGVAELRVGVPFPTYALEILRYAATPQHLQELVLLGRSYEPEQALGMGLIDEVVEPDALLERATRIAGLLGAVPAGTFALAKRALRGPALERIERVTPLVDPEVVRLWKSGPVTASIKEFLEKTFGTSERRGSGVES